MRLVRIEIDVKDENGHHLTAVETCPSEEYESTKERAIARLEASGFTICFIKLRRDLSDDYATCPKCGVEVIKDEWDLFFNPQTEKLNYCPNCGAKMQ